MYSRLILNNCSITSCRSLNRRRSGQHYLWKESDLWIQRQRLLRRISTSPTWYSVSPSNVLDLQYSSNRFFATPLTKPIGPMRRFPLVMGERIAGVFTILALGKCEPSVFFFSFFGSHDHSRCCAVSQETANTILGTDRHCDGQGAPRLAKGSLVG